MEDDGADGVDNKTKTGPMEEDTVKEEFLPKTRIWSWGAGTHGQLASGDFLDHWEPFLLSSFSVAIEGSIGACPRIIDMAGGGAHAVAILSTDTGHGQVVTWGNGHSGALGHGDEADLCVPKLVNFFLGIRIYSVAAGWSHTAFVSDYGELYTCGHGSFGQLGHGDLEMHLVPSKVEALASLAVSMVACGMRHTLVLAHGIDGVVVYGFGSSKRGQVGIGPLSDFMKSQSKKRNSGTVPIPEKIVAVKELQIVLIAANGDHSAALSDTGGLYLWGRGFSGGPDVPFPAAVHSKLHFSHIALGWNHAIALADGQIWAWGSNDRGQLGIPKFSGSGLTSVTWTNKMFKTSESMPPTTVSVVGNVQSAKGKRHGEPFATDTDVCIKEMEVGLLPVVENEGGLSSLLVINRVGVDLVTESLVERCGLHHHMWKVVEKVKVNSSEAKRVKWLSAGAEHSAVVLEDETMMVWGWGEHGQLGLGTADDQYYPVIVPNIPSQFAGKPRLRTFCGSGFTFAVADTTVE